MDRTDHVHDLIAAVRGALAGLADGARVVVAVSGGADSIALAHLAAAARPDLILTVAHVRHGLRDDTADAAAARRAAEDLGLGWVERIVTVGSGEGPEDAARRARRTALREVADLVDSRILLLGHTADDQAETVLLRITRGTGPDGLAGMSPDTVRDGLRVVRPLLALRRADVRQIPPPGTWVEDPTNDDPDQRRARARHDVLPVLSRLRPDEGDVVPALVRLADLARADRRLLDQLARQVAVQRYGPAVLVPRDDGAAAGLLQPRVLRRGWQALPGTPTPPPARIIDAILDLPDGGGLSAPGGVEVTASARGWVLDPDPGLVLPRRELALGGELHLPEHRIVLRCRAAQPLGTGDDLPIPSGGHGTTAADAAAVLDPPPWRLHLPVVGGPLLVSSRGAEGARDVRDDLRRLVPPGLRHLVPILRAVDGRALALGSRPLARSAPGAPVLVVTAAAVDGAGVAVGYPPGP